MAIMAHAQGEWKAALEAACIEARHDGWDGPDSKGVRDDTWMYAESFLHRLPGHFLLPEITPDSDGEILFEWDQGPHHVFSVSVGPKGGLSYAGLFGEEQIHGQGDLHQGIPEEILSWLARLSQYATA